MNRNGRIVRSILSLCVLFAAACESTAPTATTGSTSITLNPCSPSGTLTLAVATATLVDCSGGGTTLTLAGGGASYLIFPQFPTETAADAYVDYQLFTGPVASAVAASVNRISAARIAMAQHGALVPGRTLVGRNMLAQHAAEKVLRARAARNAGGALITAAQARQVSMSVSKTVNPPPALGSLRTFRVASSFTTDAYASSTARLAYIGANIFIYIDTLSPANGFTPAQLTAFGVLFDQTLYPIDTGAFGPPSDIDNNGHVIMLMTPIVNADTPTATCASQGFVGGFFDTGDFDPTTGPSADPNSNGGEIFYSIVPDTTGEFSCAHGVGEVGQTVPATFMHELQHLINFSQHVVISGGQPASSWMDEGMSILAEELGSLYYEQKCPGTSCRTNPAQLFPDSSQGFVEDFLYDSYEYALLPDTGTIMLSNDSENGFSWRGGAWLFARYLGDHFGSTVFRQLETGPSDAMADVQQVTGQSFTTLFGSFGLALYTDSLPGLPRTTAPLANRFVTRNLSQLWARLFATSGPAPDIPYASPFVNSLSGITGDNSTYVLLPGTMTFGRLDTPPSSVTVTIQFSPPGGVAFPSILHSQMAIFRLPPGQ
jgi:hypothetical protein